MSDFMEWIPRQWAFRTPKNELERIKNHLEGIYQALGEGVESIRKSGEGVYPAVNLSEDAEHFYLKAELPGVSISDLELSLEGNSLIIRGERKATEAEANVNFHRREREGGSFRRVVHLPAKVDGDQIKANLKDGLLLATLPKAIESKAKKIEIKVD